MPTLPGSLFPGFFQLFDDDGDPLSGGKVYWFIAGTSTPKDTFTDSNLTTPNANPVILDSAGRATIFLEPGGYDAQVDTSADVTLYTVTDIEDVGLTFLSELGQTFATGTTAAASGYTVVASDNLVVVTNAASDDPATVTLPAATARTFPLTIKNKTAVTLQINPDGSDTLESGLTSYTLPAALSPSFPSVVLDSDGVSVWWIRSSHDV